MTTSLEDQVELPPSTSTRRMRRAWIVLAALVAVFTLSRGTAAATPTHAPTGPQNVGRQDAWITTDRTDPWAGGPRKIAVTAWYPTTAVGQSRYLADSLATEAVFAAHLGVDLGAPLMLPAQLVGRTVAATMNAPVVGDQLPVVLVSPGFGMPKEFMSITAMNLASRGYLAVVMSHTHDAMVTRMDTGLVGQSKQELNAAYLDKVIDARVSDVRSVLDALPTLPFGTHADMSRIATLGHSYGGYAAVESMVDEPRISAGIALDGNLGLPGTRASKAAQGGVDRPVLVIGDEGLNSPTWDEFRAHSSIAPVMVPTPGVAHNQFSDLCAVSGSTLDPRFCGTTDPLETLRLIDVRVAQFLASALR